MGGPYLQYRDDRDRERVHRLPDSGSVTIGRSGTADISLPWDERVSRLHARLELVGDDPTADWTVVDDGPSRNGSFVNGERVRGRSRLSHGDTLAVGSTAMTFRAPATQDPERAPDAPEPAEADLALTSETRVMPRPVTRASLSDTQRRVLAELARPPDAPASDEEIAAHLFLAAETVAQHVRVLAVLYGAASLPPLEQRARIVDLARRSGILRQL